MDGIVPPNLNFTELQEELENLLKKYSIDAYNVIGTIVFVGKNVGKISARGLPMVWMFNKSPQTSPKKYTEGCKIHDNAVMGEYDDLTYPGPQDLCCGNCEGCPHYYKMEVKE